MTEINEGNVVVRIITRLNVGGPAKHVFWVSEGLNKRSWNNILVYGSVESDEHQIEVTGKPVYSLFVKHMVRRISPLNDLKSIHGIYKTLRHHKPTIIHTHTAKAGMVGRAAALLYKVFHDHNVKVVHTFHGHSFHGYFSKWKHRFFLSIERTLARSISDAIITISRQQQDEILKTYKVGSRKKHHIIPLGIDTSFVDRLDKHSLRSQLNIEGGDRVFGIVGRIATVKNHHLFISSIIEFNKLKNERCHFVVVGSGADLEIQELEDYARDNNVQNIHFIGNQTDPAFFYGALDYLVLTSKNEGTPVCILEAFAAEIPVISTPAGGVVDLLGNNERGLIAQPTASDLALQYQYALDHDLTEMTARAKQFVFSKYTLEKLTDNLENLYQNLSGQT